MKEKSKRYEPFCLYGFIMALFVRARFMMSDQEFTKQAKDDLGYAVTCLGKEGEEI